jgi:hypothetical protein
MSAFHTNLLSQPHSPFHCPPPPYPSQPVLHACRFHPTSIWPLVSSAHLTQAPLTLVYIGRLAWPVSPSVSLLNIIALAVAVLLLTAESGSMHAYDTDLTPLFRVQVEACYLSMHIFTPVQTLLSLAQLYNSVYFISLQYSHVTHNARCSCFAIVQFAFYKRMDPTRSRGPTSPPGHTAQGHHIPPVSSPFPHQTLLGLGQSAVHGQQFHYCVGLMECQQHVGMTTRVCSTGLNGLGCYRFISLRVYIDNCLSCDLGCS